MFYGGREHRTTISFSFFWTYIIQLQNSATRDKLNKVEWSNVHVTGQNDTKRKKLKTDVKERQLNYNSKMKESRKRGPKFHVDEYVSIKIDPVDKISPLHLTVLIGKITKVENDYAKIVTKFGRLKTYISTKRLNKYTATNIQLDLIVQK